MTCEGKGLFIGLVKFAFHIDGERLLGEIFEPFFDEGHKKEYLEKLFLKSSGDSSCSSDSGSSFPSELYSPKAYRMFGSHGLAILALIDEYAFCSRIFNAGHIDAKEKDINQYTAVVLTGSSETFKKGSYLSTCAKETFLRENERFPFIGIIRIKLDFHGLTDSAHGGGRFTRAIKKHIDKWTTNETAQQLRSIIVDTYDNCELTVVAFSNSIKDIDSFLKRIRKIKYSDVFSGSVQNEDASEYVCSSCHMSYGYDIDFKFEDSGKKFCSWDKEKDALYSVNCLIEPKPGHREALHNYLENQEILSEKFSIRRTITGGSILHGSIPIEKISRLQELAQEDIDDVDKKGQLRKHARRIKLTLNDEQQRSKKEEDKPRTGLDKEPPYLPTAFITEVKDKLHAIGVSKVVRERLLSLLDLYNDCARNHLQTYYFQRLEPSVKNILEILQDFLDNEEEPLGKIEQALNEEITALETAFYNRMHNKMTPNVVLEYGGGVQQFLQAFGFAYKEVIRCLSPDQAAVNYSLITSATKESSTITHTELNINHIIYPQLFSVTSWKEASNYMMRGLKKKRIHVKPFDIQEAYDYFDKFIRNKDSFASLFDLILNQTDLVKADPVYRSLAPVLPDVLEYSFQDYLVYHFAFQRDFGLMWRYYLKVFLQTPNIYRRRGKVRREAFVFILFRLMLVAYREVDKERKKSIKKFIAEQKKQPFDHLLSSLWFECFEKVKDVTEKVCKNTELYGYTFISNHLTLLSEYFLFEAITTNENENEKERTDKSKRERLTKVVNKSSLYSDLNAILDFRKERVTKMVKNIKSFEDFLDEDFINTPDDTLCLMSAFLQAVDSLDTAENKKILLHSVPHNPEDGKLDFKAIKELSGVAANLLADPTGGFIVPDPENRKKYYAYRTILYRTLWDLSYRHGAKVYTNT